MAQLVVRRIVEATVQKLRLSAANAVVSMKDGWHFWTEWTDAGSLVM